MKNKYKTLDMKVLVLECDGPILVASSEPELKEEEYNAHTDDYDTKNFSLTNISFD